MSKEITIMTGFFPDHRTDRILGINFVDGYSTEPINSGWLEKWKALGDGCKLEIRTDKYRLVKEKEA